MGKLLGKWKKHHMEKKGLPMNSIFFNCESNHHFAATISFNMYDPFSLTSININNNLRQDSL